MIDPAVLRRIAEECREASLLLNVGHVRADLDVLGVRVTASTVVDGQRHVAQEIISYAELAAWDGIDSMARTVVDRMRLKAFLDAEESPRCVVDQPPLATLNGGELTLTAERATVRRLLNDGIIKTRDEIVVKVGVDRECEVLCICGALPYLDRGQALPAGDLAQVEGVRHVVCHDIPPRAVEFHRAGRTA